MKDDSDSTNLRRIFFGIHIAQPFAKQLIQEITLIHKKINNKIRWVKDGNFHLTLIFLGDLPADKLQRLMTHVDDKMHEIELHAFELSTLRVAHFPKPSARIVAGISDLGLELAELFHFLCVCASDLELKYDDRPLRPHITLGRIDKSSTFRIDPIELSEFKLSIDEFQLFESRPVGRGNVYIPLKTYPLKGK